MSEESQNAIQNFIRCCQSKDVYIVRISSTEVCFVVKGYLEYFDEDVAKAVIANDNSCVYRPGGIDYSDRISCEDINSLMTAIFIDRTIKVRLCAAFKYVLGQSIISTSYNFGNEYKCFMPNPHIQLFKDLGSADDAIRKLIYKNNFDGAVSCCIAYGALINLADSVVMQKFMEALYGMNNSLNNNCLELPNGIVVTPKLAIAWLKQNK